MTSVTSILSDLLPVVLYDGFYRREIVTGNNIAVMQQRICNMKGSLSIRSVKLCSE